MNCLFFYTNYSELRSWVILFLAIIGGVITILTFINTLKQRKLENTYKTIDFLRNHITTQQIDKFIELYQANNFLRGVKENEFRFSDGYTDTVEYMFSEGGCGNGDIHNLIELFNLISPQLNKLNFDLIWFEYGQIMDKLYEWTSYLDKVNNDNYKSFYYEFNLFMNKNQKKLLDYPWKHYTYIE
ncbi:hypothetical protein [Tenacibaculum discolor]|uniref:hypothetical protein n=1 Tax=Tenacibaculum discolor TaxID=361581 RepID=UPI000EAEC329|nr:hypothetical protein [Tenacibaculum discolor]RLK03088.1 hypothetical protein C8N27_0936 [Tenacibaculum discolor]